MAFYENQSEMFRSRAESFKQAGDRYHAQAMSAKESGKTEKHQEYMTRAEAQYQMQRENEAKAKEHAGKTWK